MNRELAATLKDLGLSATDSAIYVALLEHAADGPITAYRLAQELGRDPANVTKAIGMMVKRGAVTASGKRPRLYAPVPPREFLGELVAGIEARREQAVAMLEQIGTAPPDGRPHVLEHRDEMFDRARLMLAAAERIVLVHAAREWLDELADDLARVADERGAIVLTRATVATAVPGPWLRLVVDGELSLDAVGRPQSDALLLGRWSRNPAEAYLAHRELGLEVVLDDVMELLHEGASGDMVRRRAEDQWALLQRQVRWKRRWREAGLAEYSPAPDGPDEIAPEEVAEAMAEVSAEFTPETPGQESAVGGEEVAATADRSGRVEAAGADEGVDEVTEAGSKVDADEPRKAAAANAAEPDDSGPLKFIFRRRRKN
jgi:sugar-specific transcriptional regulator TrmB